MSCEAIESLDDWTLVDQVNLVESVDHDETEENMSPNTEPVISHEEVDCESSDIEILHDDGTDNRSRFSSLSDKGVEKKTEALVEDDECELCRGSSHAELPEDLYVERVRSYTHHPNSNLNSTLNLVLLVSMVAVTGLGVGHFLGWSSQWVSQQQQITHLKFLQEEVIAYIDSHAPPHTLLSHMDATDEVYWVHRFQNALHMGVAPSDTGGKIVESAAASLQDEACHNEMLMYETEEDESWCGIEEDTAVPQPSSHDPSPISPQMGWQESSDGPTLFHQAAEEPINAARKLSALMRKVDALNHEKNQLQQEISQLKDEHSSNKISQDSIQQQRVRHENNGLVLLLNNLRDEFAGLSANREAVNTLIAENVDLKQLIAKLRYSLPVVELTPPISNSDQSQAELAATPTQEPYTPSSTTDGDFAKLSVSERLPAARDVTVDGTVHPSDTTEITIDLGASAESVVTERDRVSAASASASQNSGEIQSGVAILELVNSLLGASTVEKALNASHDSIQTIVQELSQLNVSNVSETLIQARDNFMATWDNLSQEFVNPNSTATIWQAVAEVGTAVKEVASVLSQQAMRVSSEALGQGEQDIQVAWKLASRVVTTVQNSISRGERASAPIQQSKETPPSGEWTFDQVSGLDVQKRENHCADWFFERAENRQKNRWEQNEKEQYTREQEAPQQRVHETEGSREPADDDDEDDDEDSMRLPKRRKVIKKEKKYRATKEYREQNKLKKRQTQYKKEKRETSKEEQRSKDMKYTDAKKSKKRAPSTPEKLYQSDERHQYKNNGKCQQSKSEEQRRKWGGYKPKKCHLERRDENFKWSPEGARGRNHRRHFEKVPKYNCWNHWVQDIKTNLESTFAIPDFLQDKLYF